MKRKLIALAVASLASGAALAQTNVTMYGVVDAGYVYSSGNAGRVPPVYNAAGVLLNPRTAGLKIPGTNTFSGIAPGISAGNRFGVKGEEALGNGLKAVFTLEYGLNIDNNSGIGNTGGLNARQQFVGLSSNYGTVALGRQYAPGFDATANNDALDATDMSIQSSFSAYAGDTITPNSGARYNNAVTYTSNNYSGVTVKAIYGFGESNLGGTYNDKINSIADNGKVGFGINYANGPINLDAVYQSRLNTVVADPFNAALKAPGSGKSINEWYVGGSYDFKVVKLYASYQALDNNNKIVYNGIEDNQLWTLGVTAPIGAGTLGLSYGKLEIDRRNVSDGDSWGWGTMYTYPLSKRTAVYAAYTYISNDSHSLPLNTQSAGDIGQIGAVGETNYTLGAGIRHSF